MDSLPQRAKDKECLSKNQDGREGMCDGFLSYFLLSPVDAEGVFGVSGKKLDQS